MAVNITLSIPDEHVAAIKAAYEYLAIIRGDLQTGQTFTNPQVQSYIKTDLTKRVKEIVLTHKQDLGRATADATAKTETNTISIS